MQENTGCCLGGWLGLIGAGVGLFLCTFDLFLGILVMIVSIVLGMVIAWVPVAKKNRKDEAYALEKGRKIELAKNALRPQYDALYRSMGVPDGCVTLSSKGHPDLYCWIADGTLNFLTEWQHVEWTIEHNVTPDEDIGKLSLLGFYCFKEQIPFDRIHHFQREGESYVETKVKGGGRATARIYPDSSAPSVIDLPEIETETIRHDERATVLYFYEDDEHTRMTAFHYTYDAYQGFMFLMPEKEYSRVVAEEAAAASGGSGEKGSLSERLEQLKALREADLITQEEYEEKKDELLKEL